MHKISDEADFESKVSKNIKPVLVDFFATWCGPCKKLTPILEEVSTQLKDKIEIYKLDVDEVGEIASKYSVQSIPTLIIFKEGQEVDRKLGFMSKADLTKWLAAY